jgi:hypothetical protein
LKSSSAAGKFAARYVKPAAGRTLIVGSFIADGKEDRRRAFPNALGVDMRDGPGVDRVVNLEDALPSDIGFFQHVECCSVLEHSRRPWLLAANLERVLVAGGTLHLSVPFIWRYHGYPGDLWRFTHEAVRELFQAIEWTHLMYASNRLRDDHFVNGLDNKGHPYLPRCEVVGFGVRK